MIHAYNEQFPDIIQRKVSAMFELAVLEEHIEIDAFAQKFLSSPVCRALETADPVYALGKSANELLALILDKEPLNIETSSYASPEYWVGLGACLCAVVLQQALCGAHSRNAVQYDLGALLPLS